MIYLDVLIVNVLNGRIDKGIWNGKTTKSGGQLYLIIDNEPIHVAYVYPASAEKDARAAIADYEQLQEMEMEVVLGLRNKYEHLAK